GTVVGGIAHDFNNMLAGMTGNLYLAQLETKDNPSLSNKLDMVEQLAFRAAEMVQRLLAFARKTHIEMKHVPLTPFFKEALKLSRAFIPEDINMQEEFPSEELTINADATQLQQVLMNLLSNARDAVKECPNPEIRITLSQFEADESFKSQHPDMQTSRFAHIRISDNGSGISKENLEHIFDPFFTTKEVGEGTGLGLAMVYGLWHH
ncbi:MAG: ATP-binding protein, partial [Mariprofundaceae bacterium]